MIQHEANFGLIFRAWWRSQTPRLRGVFELKDTRGKTSFSFSEVKEAQIESGFANESLRGNLIRVSSGTAGTGDYIGLVEDPTYIVIKYPAFFVLIPIGRFYIEKRRSARKSLTWKRAVKIAEKVINI